jgi:hypothetical protein
LLHQAGAHQDEHRKGGRLFNLLVFRRWLLVLLGCATVIQLAFFFSIGGAVLACTMLFSSIVGLLYALRRTILLEYPISSIVIAGYIATSSIIPLIGQTLNWHSVAINLHYPILDSGYIAISISVAIAAHKFYRSFSFLNEIRNFISWRIYQSVGAFIHLNSAEMLTMGIIGTTAALLVSKGHVSDGILKHLMNGYSSLMFLPVLGFMSSVSYPRRGGAKAEVSKVSLAYVAIIICIAIVVNSRGILVASFSSVALLYLYRIIVGNVPAPRVTVKMLAVVALSIYLIVGPVTNLMFSILVVRGVRSTASSTEMLSETWKVFRSGKARQLIDSLAINGSASAAGDSHYSEVYFGNIMLDRLANIRLLDNSAGGASLMSDEDKKRVQTFDLKMAIGVVPGPILELCGVNVNKSQLVGTDEDLILALTTGAYIRIGNYLTGSMFPDCYIDFGYFWPVILFAGLALFFAISDGTSGRDFDNKGNLFPVFNPITATTLFGTFMMMSNTDSIVALWDYVARNWLQDALIIWTAVVIARYVSTLLSRPSTAY